MTLLLLLLLSLLHTTTSSVYTVVPDDHYNTTCHHCHNLQHYLLNTTKYFTSNTQLLFLPGLHHLNTDLIIQNFHNISLIGITPNVIIDCSPSVGIVITNVVNVVIMDMVISNCAHISYSSININKIDKFNLYASMIVLNCYHVSIKKVTILSKKLSLQAINVLGLLTIDSLKSKGIELIYNDDLNYENELVQLITQLELSIFNLFP